MLHRPILLVLLLTLPAVGQESKPQESKPTTVLKVRFSHPRVAMALRALAPEGMDEAMAMTAGQSASFSLDSKLQPSPVIVAEGEAPALEATLDPAAVMAGVPPQELANAHRRFEGAIKLVMTNFGGVDNKEAAKVVAALWSFPKQVAQVHLEIRVDREAPAPGEATLRLLPAAGSPFAAALKSLQPLPGGAPVLDRGEAFSTMRLCLSLAPLDPLTQALARWSSALIVKDEESRAKMAEYSMRTMALLTGDVGMVWGKNGVSMLYSTRDPKALAEFAASDVFGANFRYMEESNLVESVQYEPNAFVHRGVTVARGEQTMKKSAAGSNPMLPEDGVMRQYLAVVKEWMISAATEADARKLIDAAQDGKIKRVPLTEGNFAEFDFDTSALAAQMQGGALPFEQVRFTAGMQDRALRLKFSWK